MVLSYQMKVARKATKDETTSTGIINKTLEVLNEQTEIKALVKARISQIKLRSQTIRLKNNVFCRLSFSVKL